MLCLRRGNLETCEGVGQLRWAWPGARVSGRSAARAPQKPLQLRWHAYLLNHTCSDGVVGTSV